MLGKLPAQPATGQLKNPTYDDGELITWREARTKTLAQVTCKAEPLRECLSIAIVNANSFRAGWKFNVATK